MRKTVVKSSPFWHVTKRRCAVSNRLFGTICRSLLKGSNSLLGLLDQ